jgi:hypothetical protein
MTEQDLAAKLSRSEEDIAAGRVHTQEELDARMKARASYGRNPAV